MPPLSLPALLAALAQGATDAGRPESGALLPVVGGLLLLGLLLGALRFAYLRARGPRRRGG